MGSRELIPFQMPSLARGFLQEYQAPESDDIDITDLPENIKGWKEIPADFDPTFFFQSKGDYLIGVFLGTEPMRGPHNSNVHKFEIGQGNKAVHVGVWGSTSLDAKLKKVKAGQRVAVLRGEAHPSTKGNDWINYFVKVAG